MRELEQKMEAETQAISKSTKNNIDQKESENTRLRDQVERLKQSCKNSETLETENEQLKRNQNKLIKIAKEYQTQLEELKGKIDIKI